jgi:hypothetical protein
MRQLSGEHIQQMMYALARSGRARLLCRPHRFLKQTGFIGLHFFLCSFFFALFILSDNPTPRLLAVNEGYRAETGNFPLTYTLSINVFGDGVVLRSPAKPFYTHGEQVELAATPTHGQTFVSWTGDLEGQTLLTTIAINGNKVITATFSGPYLRLTLDALGVGAIQAEPAQNSYAPGTLVTLRAIPGPGWQFVGWNGNLGANSPLALTIHRDRHIVATFIQQLHTLSLGTYTHGRVVITPHKELYLPRDIVTLTAIPDAGHHFVKWQVGWVGSTMEEVVTDNPAVFSMMANVIYTPHFAESPGGLATLYLPLILNNQ